MSINRDREINLKQLIIVSMLRWKLYLVVATIISVFFYGAYLLKCNHSQMDPTSYENYKSEKANYDRLNNLYERCIDESLEFIENETNGTKEPETDLDIDVIQKRLQALYYVDIIKGLKDGLEKPVEPESLTRRKISVQDALVSVAARVVLGFGLMVFITGVYYTIRGAVLDGDEMSHRYKVPIITVFCYDDCNSILRHGRESNYLKESIEDQIRIGEANISVYAPEAREFLLVSTISEEAIGDVKLRLQEIMPECTFSFAECLIKRADSYDLLRRSKNVIVVEKIVCSNYNDIDREMELLYRWKKNIVGVVLRV